MIYETVGAAVRRIRTAAGWQQNTLAAGAGISPQYWCDIEAGKRVPPPDKVVEIAIVLEVDSVPLMWLWLAQQVGDEMVDAMIEHARAAQPPASEGA